MSAHENTNVPCLVGSPLPPNAHLAGSAPEALAVDDDHNAQAALRWTAAALAELWAIMLLRGRQYDGPIIPDGRVHEIETVNSRREPSMTWYMIKLGHGPSEFFGWTDASGDVTIRWRAGNKTACRVPEKYLESALSKFRSECDRVDDVIRAWPDLAQTQKRAQSNTRQRAAVF